METGTPEPSMQLLAEAAQNETRSLENGNEHISDQDDRSSSLSDLDEHQATEGTDHNDRSSHDSEGEDTEAETERLEESPQKQRKQKQVLLSGNTLNGGTTIVEEKIAAPDQIVEAKTSDKTEQNGQDNEADGAPQTSDISSLGDSAGASELETNSSSSSKKRKRETEDDTKRSLKKVALELANHVADQADENAHPSSPPQGTIGEDEPTIGDADASEEEGEQSTPEEQPEDDQGNEHPPEPHDAADSNDEDVDMEDAGHEADAASSARSEEEVAKKKAAMDMLSKIESSFAILRDKLFAHRNMQLTEELGMMQSENTTHPEYLAMVEAVEQLRKEKLKHAQTLYNYKVQALRNRSTANRAQILSQYVQAARDLRESALEEIGKEWYQIQRGRRRIDEEENVALNHFSGERLDHIVYHNAYNTEVSILSGIAKHVGFPAAPPIEGAKQSEIEEDLRQMGISRQPVTVPITSNLHFSRPRPAAEEQFLENTPWANPSHPIHMINSAHRQVSNQAQPSSQFTTPLNQKRVTEAQVGSAASTIAAFPSSSLAPTPLSADIGAEKALRNTADSTTENLAETPSRPSDRESIAQNKKLPTKISQNKDSFGQKAPEKLSAGPTESNTGPVENQQHMAKPLPPSPRDALQPDVDNSSIKQDRVETEFTPQPSVQASVEVGNS